MDRITVPLHPCFSAVDSAYLRDEAAWQTALEIVASGLARRLGCEGDTPPAQGGNHHGNRAQDHR